MKQNLKKEKALQLRSQGKSYGEILKILNISSKGLLSYWFKNVTLSPLAIKRLERKKLLARKRGLFQFNKNRTRKIVLENASIIKKSKKEVSKISKSALLLIGAVLYWAEGTTRERLYGYPIVSFSNSDPAIIEIFMKYIRTILQVPDTKIYAGIHIHQNIQKETAKIFWSKITGLPKDRFYIFNQISKASKGKRPSHFLPYGTLNIRINNRQLLYRIKGHIQGITLKII